MSDNNAEPQAAIAVAEAAPESVAPEAAPTTPDITNLDPQTRDAVLFGFPAQPVTPAEAKREQQQTEQPPAAEVKPAEAEPKTEKILPNRISTAQFDDREQEAIALRHDLEQKGEKISLLEACRRVEEKYSPPKAEAPAATEPEPAPDPAASLKARLEEVKAKLKTAATDEGLYSEEIDKLNEERAELVADIKLATLRAEQETAKREEAARAERLNARQTTKAAVLQEYPTANDDDSLLGAEVSLLYNQLRADPQNAGNTRLAQDDGPRWLVEQAANRVTQRLMRTLGLSEEQAIARVKGQPEAKSPVQPETPKTAVPRNAPVTLTAPRQEAVSPPTLDAREALRMARNDPKARDAALWGDSGTVLIL